MYTNWIHIANNKLDTHCKYMYVQDIEKCNVNKLDTHCQCGRKSAHINAHTYVFVLVNAHILGACENWRAICVRRGSQACGGVESSNRNGPGIAEAIRCDCAAFARGAPN